MSCLVLIELVLGLFEVFFLEPDLALLLGRLGREVAFLVLFEVELGQGHLDLGGDDVAFPLVALDLQLLLGGFDLGDGLLDLDVLLSEMFLSISEESNLQTISPFLTLVPSGTRLMILIWLALTSQMPSTVTQLSRLPRSVTVIRKVALRTSERSGPSPLEELVQGRKTPK